MEEKEPDKVEEPIVEYGRLDLNGIYTYWDYLKWQFEERVELIRGKVFRMSPAPNVNHQRICRNLALVIFSRFKSAPCEAFVAPFDVRLPIPNEKKDTTVVQPDFCIVCDSGKLEDGRACNGAPDLVVEILSPGNSKHDMKTKFELYETGGVKEYWIVQPIERVVFVYTLKDGQYASQRPFTEGMEAQSLLFPSLSIAVDDIFYEVPPVTS